MRILCVAEKPSISKAVSQILSGGQAVTRNTQNKFIKNYDFTYPQTNAFFTVTAVSGHLMQYDFPESHRQWHSCDPIALFEAPVESQITKTSETIERNLLNEARRADQLMIWTDCDREGENIGAEVMKVCRKANPRIVVTRARFSAIIPQQIHHAAQHPVALDQAQADAVDARSILDLRLGAAFTRLQSISLKGHIPMLNDSSAVISYGPCQFPTLGFVVSRYEQVKAFAPEAFWYIYLAGQPTGTAAVPGALQETEFAWKRGRLYEFDTSLAIYEAVLDNPVARVTKTNNKGVKKWKPLPLTTVELQKAGSRILKLAPKKILDISEKLYQQGFLSYPRTETDQFDPQFDFMTLIAKQAVDPAWGAFASQLQNGGFTTPRKGKKNDKAHPPIHPTAHNANLSGDEKRVYEFITRRFLACCSKDAEGWETTVDVIAGGEEFSTTGLIVLERNYLDVYPYDKWTGKTIPEFEQGQQFMPSICELRDGMTTQPALLTEADLVGLMDKNGIGTDATIAQHIETIITRGYVIERMEGSVKYLVPSTLGIGLIEGYNEIGFEKSLSKPMLRRDTERSMEDVCEGRKTKEVMLQESIDQYRQVFIRARQEFDKVITSVKARVDHESSSLQTNVGNGGGPGEGGDSGGGGAGGRGGGGGPGSGPRHNSAPTASSRDPQPPAPQPNRKATKTHVDRAKRPPHTSIGPPNPPALLMQRTVTAPASSSMSSAIQCRCGVTAAERTVVKDGPNKGRRFWRCGKDGECDFFEWMDGPSSCVGLSDLASTMTIPRKRSAPPVQRANSMPERFSASTGSSRRCRCDMTAISKIVSKEGPNQGRSFWCCPNSEKARCGFFEWDDDNGLGGYSNKANDGQADPTSTGECYKCGQAGHWASSCSFQGQSTGNHNRAFASTTSGNTASGTCYKCGEAGHFSNACPGGAKGNISHTQGTAPGSCFKCGDAGHYSNACPNDGKSKTVSRNRGSARGAKGSTGRKASGGSRTKAKMKSNFSAADDF